MSEVTTQLQIRAVKLTKPDDNQVEWLREYSENLIMLVAKEAIAAIRARYYSLGTTEAVVEIEKHFGLET